MRWFLKFLSQNGTLQRALWILALAALWQCAYWCGAVSPLLLPSVPTVISTLVHALLRGKLLVQVLFSIGIILLGLMIALLIAHLLAALALRFKLFFSLADTLCMLAHPLPAIAMLPIIIVYFGVGAGAITAILVHSVLWPILVNLMAGFKNTPAIYVETGRTLKLNPIQMLLLLYIPASAPYLISGVKIGWARAWRALISAEMIFGAVSESGGIGWYIFKSRVMMDTPAMYAGVIAVICIGVLAESLLRILEKKTLGRWSP